ncbi:MAG: hypothetical protein ACPLQO_00180 [Desulfotomaculales bacterium]
MSMKQAKELGIDLNSGKMQKQRPGIENRRLKLKEAQVLREVRGYLEALGWFVFRVHQSLGSHKGISDLIAVKNGRVLFVECKSQHERARQSDEQAEFQRQIEAHGGTYILARRMEDVERVIRDAG